MPILTAAFDTANAPATVGSLIAPFLSCGYNVTATFPIK